MLLILSLSACLAPPDDRQATHGAATGRVHVLADTAERVARTTTLRGEEAGDYFGNTVAAAGDVNGDRYADLLVGSPGHNASRGRGRLPRLQRRRLRHGRG